MSKGLGNSFEKEPIGVKIHPIALLSITDHYERTVGNKKNKRAIGVLLGEDNNGVYDVTNAYAVPYDEEPSQPGVFFLDHNYHESMFAMFKKINIKEKVLGWYATGKSFLDHDVEINEIWAKYCLSPVLITVDILKAKSEEPPNKAFFSKRIVNEKGMVVRIFKSVPCSVSAYEAEEVGVEHLLREIKDLDMDSLKNKLSLKISSLSTLQSKIEVLIKYIDDVAQGRKRPDKQLNLALHEIIGRLPKIVESDLQVALSNHLNDNYLSLYISSLTKNITNVHSLLNNRIKNSEDQNKLNNSSKEIMPASAKAQV